MTYEGRQYSQGFRTNGVNDDVVVEKLGWFRRVILRQKPRVIAFDEAMGKIRAAARRHEEQLAKSILEDGK